MTNTQALTQALADVVAERVDTQMNTTHASAVQSLLLAGMTRDEIRSYLIAKVMSS